MSGCDIWLTWFITNKGHTVFENHRKVSLNIGSEASYAWVDKKIIKNAKDGPYLRVFENLEVVVK